MQKLLKKLTVVRKYRNASLKVKIKPFLYFILHPASFLRHVEGSIRLLFYIK